MRKLGRILLVPPSGGQDDINLRIWFAGFVGWLVALSVLAHFGLAAYEAGSRVGMVLWLLSLYTFYLSLCCTFFPAPTLWIVMLIASNYVAGEIGVLDYRLGRLLVVGSVGAVSTAMANLNEYAIWTFILRYGKMAGIRNTRFYQVASGWFGVKPFWTIVLFSFVPIPVDVIRWLAITYRYPRAPYFLAYFLGRWVRYSCLAAVTIWGGLHIGHILIVQVTIGGIALLKIVQQLVRQHRKHNGEQPSDVETPSEMGSEPQSDIISDPTLPASDLSNTVERQGAAG